MEYDIIKNIPLYMLNNESYSFDSKFNELFWLILYARVCSEVRVEPDFDKVDANYHVKISRKTGQVVVPPFLNRIYHLLQMKRNDIDDTDFLTNIKCYKNLQIVFLFIFIFIVYIYVQYFHRSIILPTSITIKQEGSKISYTRNY